LQHHEDDGNIFASIRVLNKGIVSDKKKAYEGSKDKQIFNAK
jgi:hypothetical protein